jgi:peptide/nickel transport system substrate-binding protein
MENRFGIKDFFLFVLILVLLVGVYLAMQQYDREWQILHQINTELTQQTTELARIHQLIGQGINFNAPGTTGPSAATEPSAMAGFERVLKSQAAPDYAQGDDLVDTFMAVPEKLTPIVSNDFPSFVVQSFVLDTLTDRDPNTLAYIPRLATSWKVSDDQLTIDFELRRGVTFSDGSPFSADDVVFTFDLIRNPNIEAPAMRSMMDRLQSVQKLDDYHVRFKFREPYFLSFDTCAATPILSKAFYSKFTAEQFNESEGYLIGSGPYRLPDPESWRPSPGQPIILTRNERYWGPVPSFNKVIWKVIEDPSARTTAFLNGDTDTYNVMLGLTSDQYDQLAADPAVTARANHWSLDVPTEGFIYVGWNEKQGRDGPPTPFADPRVRRAMTMLTDRDAIIKQIERGYASPITGPFSPLTPQADPTIQPWPYDPVAAEKLLNDAGFHRQGDVMVGPDGKPLQFKIMYNSSNDARQRIASFLHDAYARAGILATPEPVEWSVMLKRLDERQYDVYLGGWSGTLEFDAYGIFHSSQAAGTGDNFIQYSDPAVDQVIEQARSTVDESKRMPIWHKVNQILHEDEPYTFLYIEKDLTFLDKRFHGLEVTKEGLNSSAEWYVPLALQKYHD